MTSVASTAEERPPSAESLHSQTPVYTVRPLSAEFLCDKSKNYYYYY